MKHKKNKVVTEVRKRDGGRENKKVRKEEKEREPASKEQAILMIWMEEKERKPPRK